MSGIIINVHTILLPSPSIYHTNRLSKYDARSSSSQGEGLIRTMDHRDASRWRESKIKGAADAALLIDSAPFKNS